MIRYGRLLAPIDGSDAAYAATRTALAVAGATGGTVDLLHVLASGRGGAGLGGEDPDAIHGDHGRTLLSTAEAMAEGTGVAVTTTLAEGTPHEAILAQARERGSHLLAMGRHGTDTVGDRLLGGVTERVLRAGQLPVLAVRGAHGPTVAEADAVLLPTDGSEPAELAGEHAASLAALAGATVHVVSVVDVPAAAGGSGELSRNLEARAEASVERLSGRVRAATGGRVETAVRSGRAAPTLADYVRERDVDAVVMGAHGRSGLERWLLGSVTERLLRTVEVPVLVVPGS